MTRMEMANDIQRSLNSMTELDIKATENNMRHLYGAMNVLAKVRDALLAGMPEEKPAAPAAAPQAAEESQAEAGKEDGNG